MNQEQKDRRQFLIRSSTCPFGSRNLRVCSVANGVFDKDQAIACKIKRGKNGVVFRKLIFEGTTMTKQTMRRFNTADCPQVKASK